MQYEAAFDWLKHEPIGWLMLLVLGSVLGSFINVVIYRLPRGLSLLHPPSNCPGCGRPIRPHENIPLLSYVALGGRCRGCGVRIPIRYPVVELLGGLLTLFAVRLAPSPAAAAVWSAFTLALLAIVFIDLDFRVIPDRITLPGVLLGLLWAAVGPPPFLDALVGAVAGGGGLLLIALVYRLVTGREGLGMGDVKLMAMVGAFLGWQGALGTLLFGSLAGSLVGAGLIMRGRGTGRTALPFGSFLAPAAWVVLFAGRALWAGYLSFFSGL